MKERCDKCRKDLSHTKRIYRDKEADKVYCFYCARELYPDSIREIQKKRDQEKKEEAERHFNGLVILIVSFLLISGTISLFYWGKGWYINISSDNNSISTIRDVKGKTFKKRGELLTSGEQAAKETSLKEFIESNPSYRMEGDFEYANYESGKAIKLRTNVSMFYNHEKDVYKFIIKSRGGSKKINSRFSIANGTYYIVKESGKTYVLSQTSNEKKAIDISQDKSLYNFLISYRMGTVIPIHYFSNGKGKCYHLWDAEYYHRTYDDIGYRVYSNPQTELKVYKDRPAYYLHRIKNEDTGIEYQFTLNYYYNKIPKEIPSVSDYQ